MNNRNSTTHRRSFLKTAIAGGLAAAARLSDAASTEVENRATRRSRVALTSGNDRTANTFQALKLAEREIVRAIGNRRVVIKPNNVAINIQLSATHADCLLGILEFLKSIGKLDGAAIAESAANGPTLEGFANYGYPRVAAKYGVKLLDLDQQPHEVVHVFNETDFRPHPVRMSRLLLDRGSFLI